MLLLLYSLLNPIYESIYSYCWEYRQDMQEIKRELRLFEDQLLNVNQELFGCLKGKFLKFAPEFRSFFGKPIPVGEPYLNRAAHDMLVHTIEIISDANRLFGTNRNLVNTDAVEKLKELCKSDYKKSLVKFCNDVNDIVKNMKLERQPDATVAFINPFAKVKGNVIDYLVGMNSEDKPILGKASEPRMGQEQLNKIMTDTNSETNGVFNLEEAFYAKYGQ